MSNSFHQGNKLVREGKFTEAITVYQEAIALNPHYCWLHYNLGVAYEKVGFFDNAIAVYQKVIALQPKSPWSYYNLGQIFTKQNKLEDAISAYKSAVSLSPDVLVFSLNLAEVLVLKEKKREASQLLIKLGELLFRQGKILDAIAVYEKVVELDSSNSDIYQVLGECYHHQGDFLAARICYQKAMQDLTANRHVWFYKTWGEALEGEKLKINHSLQLKNSSAWSCYLQGQKLETTGNYTEAIAFYQKALTINPNLIDVYYRLIAFQPHDLSLYTRLMNND